MRLALQILQSLLCLPMPGASPFPPGIHPHQPFHAGIGGTTMLDDAGVEYITGLFLIFHPWPDKMEYDTSSIKVGLGDSFSFMG